MAQSAIDKIPLGPKLDALTAEKVFGWKNVHKHEDGNCRSFLNCVANYIQHSFVTLTGKSRHSKIRL
jgi:hypothetical protein